MYSVCTRPVMTVPTSVTIGLPATPHERVATLLEEAVTRVSGRAGVVTAAGLAIEAEVHGQLVTSIRHLIQEQAIPGAWPHRFQDIKIRLVGYRALACARCEMDVLEHGMEWVCRINLTEGAPDDLFVGTGAAEGLALKGRRFDPVDNDPYDPGLSRHDRAQEHGQGQ